MHLCGYLLVILFMYEGDKLRCIRWEGRLELSVRLTNTHPHLVVTPRHKEINITQQVMRRANKYSKCILQTQTCVTYLYHC